MADNGVTRWGISATGWIAETFATDIAKARGAIAAGVASRDHAKAEAFAARFPGMKAFASLEEMAASDEIDAIYIASPHTAHLAQARIALAAGKPVLVEKPITADLAEAEALAEAARAAGIFAMEAMWSRYLPAIRLAREKIASGELGAIRRLHAELAWVRDYDPMNRFFNPEIGGGALLDLGVYPISLTRFLLGEPDAVSGTWTAAPTGTDVRAELTLRYGAAEAHLACGFDRNGDNRLVVEGEKATLVIGMPMIGAERGAIFPSRAMADLAFPGGEGLLPRLVRKVTAKLPLPGVKRWYFPFLGKGLHYEIEAASRAIRNGLKEEPDCTLASSIETLRIVRQILDQPPAGHWQP